MAGACARRGMHKRLTNQRGAARQRAGGASMTIDWTLVAYVWFLVGVVLFGIMVMMEEPYNEKDEREE